MKLPPKQETVKTNKIIFISDDASIIGIDAKYSRPINHKLNYIKKIS